MTNTGASLANGSGALAGKRIIVTGGASGIGRAGAMLMAGRGARVAVLDVDDQAGAAVAGAASPRGTIRYIRTDVSRSDETAAAVSDAISGLGGIDVLITAAGIMRGQMVGIGELDDESWHSVIAVNLTGAFLAIRQVAPRMVEQGAGVIILVSSKAGVSVGSGSFPYGASKGGMHGLALTLERHLGQRGVRVNEVCPGDVDTPLFRRSIAVAVERGADRVAAEETLARLTPPEAVAEILAFLASDAASAVRGTICTA
jgi:NAD(P)-dependent dehydrogenase (short-subunit alcohol dehydrogenase family)